MISFRSGFLKPVVNVEICMLLHRVVIDQKIQPQLKRLSMALATTKNCRAASLSVICKTTILPPRKIPSVAIRLNRCFYSCPLSKESRNTQMYIVAQKSKTQILLRKRTRQRTHDIFWVLHCLGKKRGR